MTWRCKKTGGHLNIKMPSYQCRDSHVKDKTVSPTVLSLTWKSPNMGIPIPGKDSIYIETGPRVSGAMACSSTAPALVEYSSFKGTILWFVICPLHPFHFIWFKISFWNFAQCHVQSNETNFKMIRQLRNTQCTNKLLQNLGSFATAFNQISCFSTAPQISIISMPAQGSLITTCLDPACSPLSCNPSGSLITNYQLHNFSRGHHFDSLVQACSNSSALANSNGVIA